jgi:predicted nucleotidyltransferase
VLEESHPDLQTVELLRSALGKAKGALRLALLFGSFARGKTRADSDVDIAILPFDGAFSVSDELALQGQLVMACRREVHLVRIDGAATLLLWQIMRDAVLLLGDPVYFSHLRTRAALDHADYAPLADRAALQYARAVMEQSGAAR